MTTIDRKTLAALLESGSKSPPRETRLPAAKKDYPKLLCLDTWDWVGLGRAENQRPDGRQYQQALDSIREGIRKGKLVVPLLGTPVFEAVGSEDPARRERFTRFMIGLSDNISMQHHISHQAAEMRNAARRLYLRSTDVEEVRESVLHWGVGGVFGQTEIHVPLSGNPEIDSQMNAAMQSPEFSVLTMLQARNNGTYTSLRISESETMQTVAAVRKDDALLDAVERERRECGNWLKSVVVILADALTHLQIDHNHFMLWLREGNNLQAFCRGIPSTDVLLTLMLARDRDSNSKTDNNDGLDWRYLQAAVPYANIVLTEKRWAHYANIHKLPERYNVRVTADLPRLPEILAEEGCL